MAVRQRGEEGWRAQLRAIMSECENDFHVCEKCGHQDDNATRESNLYHLLDEEIARMACYRVKDPELGDDLLAALRRPANTSTLYAAAYEAAAEIERLRALSHTGQAQEGEPNG